MDEAHPYNTLVLQKVQRVEKTDRIEVTPAGPDLLLVQLEHEFLGIHVLDHEGNHGETIISHPGIRLSDHLDPGLPGKIGEERSGQLGLVQAIMDGRKAIEKEVMSKVPKLMEEGGYIPAFDDAIMEDMRYEDVLYCAQLIKSIGL